MKKRKVKDFIALDAQKLVRDCEEYLEEEKDCIEIIKIKEIMQILEKTTDSAEYVGKILRTLIVKYA